MSDREEVGDVVARVSVPAMDALLGRRINVLDDGFVRIVDYMGSDDAVVQAARVSYGHGTKKVHEDRGLIRYLMRHRHTTPFEMCELKAHVRVPMDCWRQWIRHRTASVNEYSTRYSVAIDSTQRTAPTEWRLQSGASRQGSSGNVSPDVGARLSKQEAELHSAVRREYEARLAEGVAREQARKDLPLSTYTEAYWKIDLHNLFHFLELRLDERAQSEIREYATAISQVLSVWCPVSWEAFVDYRLEGLVFSKAEVSVLGAALRTSSEAVATAEELGMLEFENGSLRRNREREEFEDKFHKMRAPIPWLHGEK